MTKPATRDKILQAALEVFAEKGYHRALVDDIVRASRTSKGAVYHHFPNKEALFLALVDEFSARLAESIAEAIADAHGALGKVEAALRPLDLRAPSRARAHPALGIGKPGAGLPGQARGSARALRRPHPGLPRSGRVGKGDPAARYARGYPGLARRRQRGRDPVAPRRRAGSAHSRRSRPHANAF